MEVGGISAMEQFCNALRLQPWDSPSRFGKLEWGGCEMKEILLLLPISSKVLIIPVLLLTVRERSRWVLGWLHAQDG
jgi:hypothetical protein